MPAENFLFRVGEISLFFSLPPPTLFTQSFLIPTFLVFSVKVCIIVSLPPIIW